MPVVLIYSKGPGHPGRVGAVAVGRAEKDLSRELVPALLPSGIPVSDQVPFLKAVWSRNVQVIILILNEPDNNWVRSGECLLDIMDELECVQPDLWWGNIVQNSLLLKARGSGQCLLGKSSRNTKLPNHKMHG